MPICQPCRMPHNAAVCEDALGGRTGPARACFCQHKPYSAAVPMQSAGGAAGESGPECDVPETHPDTTAGGVGEETGRQQGPSHTMSSATFSRADVARGRRG